MDHRPIHQLDSDSVYDGNPMSVQERTLPEVPSESVENRTDGGIPTPHYVQVMHPGLSEGTRGSLAAIPGSVHTPKYNGKSDVRAWLYSYKYSCEAYGFSNEQKFAQLFYSLESPVLEWFLSEKISAETERRSFGWSDFPDKITQLMEGEADKIKMKLKLMQLKQQKSQTWNEYFFNKRLLIEIHGSDMSAVDKLLHLWDGLDPSIKNKVENKLLGLLERNEPKVEDLYQIIKKSQKSDNPAPTKTSPANLANPNKRPANEDQVNQLIRAVGKLSTIQNQKKEQQDKRRQDWNDKAKADNLCFGCQSPDHRYADCPKNEKNKPKNDSRN